MNLIPYRRNRETSLFGDLLDIQKEMNKLFDFSLGRWNDRPSILTEVDWAPTVDIHDEKDAIMVKADIPGVNKEDIEVSVRDGVLTIRGEKKEESETKKEGAVRVERFYGSFLREIELPSAVDDAKVKATYKDGVLALVLPKKEEAKPRQIKVDIQ